VSSINFRLEKQGQEGRSCKYSAILVAGSYTVIFYVVTLYVTYLQHEVCLVPLFALGFFCWATYTVAVCLGLSTFTPHLSKHCGRWSGIHASVTYILGWLHWLCAIACSRRN
jgi:hypothetical protein